MKLDFLSSVTIVLCVMLGVALAQNEFTPCCGQTYAELPPLPGLDFVGFGFDIRYDNVKTGLVTPLVDWTYLEKQMYTYPVYREITYKVPDQVAARTLSYTEATAYVYSNITEYSTIIANNFGIDVTNTIDKNTSVNLCAAEATQDGGVNTTNCVEPIASQEESNIWGRGRDYNYANTTFSTSEQHNVHNQEMTQMFDLVLDLKTFLRFGVKDDISKLEFYSFYDKPKLYLDFLEKYGTHYITSCKVGTSKFRGSS